MKKNLIILLSCLLLCCGCNNYETSSKIYQTNTKVEATVIDVDQKSWFAGTTHYNIKIEVQYEDLTTTIEYKERDAWNKWNEIKEGDLISVTLIEKRYINDNNLVNRFITK